MSYLLKVLVSDVAQLDEVWPQAVDLPVCISIVLHLYSQVFFKVDFTVINLPEATFQLLVVYKEANKEAKQKDNEPRVHRLIPGGYF